MTRILLPRKVALPLLVDESVACEASGACVYDPSDVDNDCDDQEPLVYRTAWMRFCLHPVCSVRSSHQPVADE